jgi:hypothetical protein
VCCSLACGGNSGTDTLDAPTGGDTGSGGKSTGATGGGSNNGSAEGGSHRASAAGGSRTGPAAGGTEEGGAGRGENGARAGGSAGVSTGGREDTHAAGGPSTGGQHSTGSDQGTGNERAGASGDAATGGATGGGSAGGATGDPATGGAAGSHAGAPSEILAPETGALLGIFYGDESIAATGAKIGRVPPLHLTYYAFEDDWTEGITQEDLQAERIPFVNWELYGTELSDIVAGAYDDMLAARAAAAAALGEKLFVDFGAEMNGDWSPWGGAQNGQSADLYLAAYRRVHEAMVAGGATNLIWAWCPNVTDEPRTAWNAAMNYYPGDDYVDWTCVDGYNWGGQSFREVFQDIYPTLAAVGKPIMIGEMSCAEQGDDKGAWIDQMVPTLKSEFPMIKGLIWFDIDKEEDWRISSSAGAEAAFARMAMDPYMNP